MKQSEATRPQPGVPPITDSPWFWLRLFSYTALIVLVAIGPRYSRRQGQVEQKSQARYGAGADHQGDTAGGRGDENVVSLRPLLVVFLGVLMLAESLLWRQRLRPPERDEAKESAAHDRVVH